MTTNVPAPEMSSSSGAGHPQSVMERAKSALEGVTDGPWVVDDHEDDDYSELTVGAGTYLKSPGCYTSTDLIYEADTFSDELDGPDYVQRLVDARFIAAARALVPELIAEVHTLTQKLAQAEAERDSWRARSGM